jgi:hypothetical protein
MPHQERPGTIQNRLNAGAMDEVSAAGRLATRGNASRLRRGTKPQTAGAKALVRQYRRIGADSIRAHSIQANSTPIGCVAAAHQHLK